VTLFRPYKAGTALGGRYVVERPLGAGSYSVAYLCFDRAEGRRVVVRHDRPGRLLARLKAGALSPREEAELLGRLNHPRIPRVYGLFRDRGRLHLVLEFKEGVNLEDALAEGRIALDERQSLEWLKDFAQVVRHLHERGVVHRDIRPPNIILEPSPASDAAPAQAFPYGVAHLVDFGLACPIADRPTRPPLCAKLRRGGAAEEMFFRRERHPRADLYAMGHLLLFLLYSGYEPPEGDPGNLVPQGWEEELRLSERTKRLLRRLLRRDKPYGTVSDLERDLDAAIAALGKPDASDD